METKPRTVYLAGPMTGYPDFNYLAFHAAAKVLRRTFGMEVINPAENFDGNQDLPREAYLVMAEEQIGRVQGVVLLPGWEKSNGVHRELRRYLDGRMFGSEYVVELQDMGGGEWTLEPVRNSRLADFYHSQPPLVPPHPRPMGVEREYEARMIDGLPMGVDSDDVIRGDLGRKMFEEFDKEVATTSAKPTNPKDALGVNKIPLHLVPPTAIAACAMALGHGALKYGRMNWRVVGVRASVYYDAVLRHLTQWMEGHNEDNDSGLSHLDHAIAGLAILIDAEEMGKLTDDRNVYHAGYSMQIENSNGQWSRMRKSAEAEGRTPTHYSRENTAGEF